MRMESYAGILRKILYGMGKTLSPILCSSVETTGKISRYKITWIKSASSAKAHRKGSWEFRRATAGYCYGEKSPMRCKTTSPSHLPRTQLPSLKPTIKPREIAVDIIYC